MLEVVSIEDAKRLLRERFAGFGAGTEAVPFDQAAARVLAEDVVASEGVPPFDRSTVDGFAVCASDTFGCSDALPALLALAGEVEMGEEVDVACPPGACVRIPTGGKIPQGADAVVMLEYCEEYGDGTVGIASSVAPSDNIVFENDDAAPGSVLVKSGTLLQPHHVGTLASLGMTRCLVRKPVRVGVISTGDEIIEADRTPAASQMRDVNAPLLAAAIRACGAEPSCFPIVPDSYDALLAAVEGALETCDAVLVSGGSSAGQKDNTARVLSHVGDLLFHGVAVKPGKPTLCADANGAPVFGLPGHPVAAYFMFLELAAPLLMPGFFARRTPAVLAEGLPSNHGRSELVPVELESMPNGKHATRLRAVPIRSKSGLISQLCTANGYLEIARDTEGLAAGALVEVTLFDRWQGCELA
ncbi:MAG: molybdopterin molybdenumtransferase MoeA [Eggerthellaceae bacterium]|nr:molybdopterin molybdenumtransferase MoeA [Eggerthellaceae bacterium]